MNDRNATNSNRMVLLLIGGIPLTMILAATWLWFFVVRGDLDLVGVLGTANRGTLVQPPRQLDEHGMHDESGQGVKFSALEPRWAMVIPEAGALCAAACEKNLYLTRQIHVAMGKDFNRLQRIFISDTGVGDIQLAAPQLSDGNNAPDDFARYLASEHAGLRALTLSTASFNTLFAEEAVDPSTWYLVDPAGWIMMSYNDEVPYKDVIADLKFLLKNSGG